MIIREKNTGTYIQYALNGTSLTFKNGVLTVDLSENERDWPVSLDIGADQSGTLVSGPSYRYIAQIGIPARFYTIEKGKADDFGFPQLKRTAVPLDTEKVTLTLWALEV